MKFIKRSYPDLWEFDSINDIANHFNGVKDELIEMKQKYSSVISSNYQLAE